MKIVSQTLIKNEQKWVWFALRSMIDWVDEAMVWDTGSEDQTVEIVKSVEGPKIRFKSVSVTDASQHTQRRQEMLDATAADWFIIVDGDEIWWRDSISQLIDSIHSNPNAAAIISPFYNAVGDIWHFQNPREISYKIHDFVGGYTLRAINRNIPGLHVTNPHGKQEYRTTDSVALQNLPQSELVFVDAPFLHLTHLHRSNSPADKVTLKRSFKYRYDLGFEFLPKNYPPEVFYFPRPSIVSDPFVKRSQTYELVSVAASAARWVKRSVIPPSKSGY